jgi:hypothetical protein
MLKRHVMAWALVLLAGASGGAWAKGKDCASFCLQKASTCAMRCGDNPKCYRLCDSQSDACIATCEERGEIRIPDAAAVKGKCPAPNGKLVPCSDLAKPVDTKPFNKKAKVEDEPETDQKPPSAAEMNKLQELGIVPN